MLCQRCSVSQMRPRCVSCGARGTFTPIHKKDTWRSAKVFQLRVGKKACGCYKSRITQKQMFKIFGEEQGLDTFRPYANSRSPQCP